ncbi:MAG: hypothetical protein K6W08_01330 [Firmicutes bacterium]|nr:hypothetical protein [Bacillota bacterium]
MTDPTGPPRALPAARDWPGRAKLAARLRAILRREFGADDAWIVHAGDRCRLEVRVGWRVVVLLEGPTTTFWTPFYVETSGRARGGRRASQRTQRGQRALRALLEGLWAARVGAPARRSPTVHPLVQEPS